MAKKDFLLQGFTAQTHFAAVEWLFLCPDIERVILSVAFVNHGGVGLISTNIEQIAQIVEVFAGIRNDITSKQGLEHLLNLGAAVNVVDTGGMRIIFHPKIYYARGKHYARVIVGSANMTLGGLNNNIEASIILDLDLTDTSDAELASDIETAFDGITSEYPDHVKRIFTHEELTKLHIEGRLLDETTSSPPHAVSTTSSSQTDGLANIKLKVPPILRRTVNRTSAPPPDKSKQAATSTRSQTPTGVKFALVWQSKPLTERDLNIPSGANTHSTGSINLDKGLLDEEVDHRHYFRDEVFQALNWNQPQKPTIVDAVAKFSLIVKGLNHGEFDLRVKHTTSTNTKTYKQHNAMSRLSWGVAKAHVAHRDLIGRTLSLYRDEDDQTRFVLEID
ncbi:hypothetical protein EPN96_10570 [bacterium]|nr:MAG: hypothetical protein EPN96_10570 [bacterium]